MPTQFGVSGDLGSFSEQAALLYAKRANITVSLVYLIDMEGVLAALERKEIELGILPVVNLQGGLVKPAFEAMGKHAFNPIDDLWLHVHQCLLALPGLSTQQITHIVSHPQGLAQCAHFIKKKFKGCELVEWCDTAQAAKALAAGTLPPSAAVIAPESCAALYGLTLIEKHIEDNDRNLTAFIIVK